ncbi:MAG: hypothetical protein K1X88_06990 [Nannocystaceae bacterium]|nr:hypothetical protein [Nannocystaceae bacterium]
MLLPMASACPASGDDAADTGDTSAATTMTATATASASTTASDSSGGSDTAPMDVDYATQIQPIWTASCVDDCHTPGGIYASLDLTTGVSYNALSTQKPVYSGDANFVVPGDSGASFLSRAVHGTDTILRQMPLDLGMDMMGNPVGVEGTPLSDADIALIDAWIDGGAME